MNTGERDELIAIVRLIQMRENSDYFDGNTISSIKVNETECLSIPKELNITEISNFDDYNLLKFTKSIKVEKAPARAKSDVQINNIGYSIKSNRAAPPALVNHTARPGFENVCSKVGVDIEKLDELIEIYWDLRFAKKIAEDVKISHPLSPFKNQIELLRPILNYFLFQGSGSGDSKYQAQKIINFNNPILDDNWKIYDSHSALDLYWDKLIFSLRSNKGMPNGYPDNMSAKANLTKQSVDVWTRFIDGNYRGALHIRTS
jgi:hypothetical protein